MKISKNKRQKISEQIISVLFENFPKPLFTAEIAREIIRDEEFTKSLLSELNKNNLVIPINKNSKGKNYLRRTRWRLSNQVYNTLIKRTNNFQNN